MQFVLQFDLNSKAQSATLQKSIRLGLEAALPISDGQLAVKDSDSSLINGCPRVLNSSKA